MQQSDEKQPRQRTLREHLSFKTVESKLRELEDERRDALLAEVTQEARDIDYERWDGMS